MEHDILDTELMLASCGLFITMEPMKMESSYFWNYVRRRVGVGSPRDRDRTTIPFSDHEVEFATRMFGRDEGCLGFSENIADEEVDDNMSVFSRGTQDESIYARECDEGVNHNSLDDLDLVADEDITDEERNELLMCYFPG